MKKDIDFEKKEEREVIASALNSLSDDDLEFFMKAWSESFGKSYCYSDYVLNR